MFNTDNEPISKSNMKKLIKLMLDAKKAKEEYETFKAEITKDLKDGKYVIENIGSVSKSTYPRYTLDKEALQEAYPYINFDDYLKESMTTKVDVRSLQC